MSLLTIPSLNNHPLFGALPIDLENKLEMRELEMAYEPSRARFFQRAKPGHSNSRATAN